ncbi:hypothetical protein [Phormidium tenue]|uniref:hypothetical protein n=1 Tax=Phormidium tenue TaxID=126344 RepID=UPI0015C54479|nr:hypothetical protein [Phormidium tenue]MBD2234982.1 hypothetical protein [Phormidium tenue FACHB-1052]
MSTVLIQTQNTPLVVKFLEIAPLTHVQLYKFYQSNRDLHIDRPLSLDSYGDRPINQAS